MRATVYLYTGLLLGILAGRATAQSRTEHAPQGAANSIKLIRVVTVAKASEGGGARPEVVATADRVFVVYLGNVVRAFAEGSGKQGTVTDFRNTK